MADESSRWVLALGSRSTNVSANGVRGDQSSSDAPQHHIPPTRLLNNLRKADSPMGCCSALLQSFRAEGGSVESAFMAHHARKPWLRLTFAKLLCHLRKRYPCSACGKFFSSAQWVKWIGAEPDTDLLWSGPMCRYCYWTAQNKTVERAMGRRSREGD